MKSSLRRYKDDHDREVRHAQLLITSRQHFFPSPTTYSSCSRQTGDWAINRIDTYELGSLKKLEALRTTPAFDKYEVRNTVLIDEAKLAALGKKEKHYNEHALSESVERRDD